MSVKDIDPLHRIAEQDADCFADSGYAFVTEDKIDGLAAVLGSFLAVAGIPVNPPGAEHPDDDPFPLEIPSTHDGVLR